MCFGLTGSSPISLNMGILESAKRELRTQFVLGLLRLVDAGNNALYRGVRVWGWLCSAHDSRG